MKGTISNTTLFAGVFLVSVVIMMMLSFRNVDMQPNYSTTNGWVEVADQLYRVELDNGDVCYWVRRGGSMQCFFNK